MAMRQDASTGELHEVADDPKAGQKTDGKPVMELKIYSPFQVYFNEAAYSLSASNATGPFDILPHHHNFMSLLSACELHIFAPSGEKRIRISGGLLLVQAEAVKVFLDV